MSACNTPVLLSPAASVAAPNDAPVTKGKSKTLPAKYAKFIQYTYYLIKKINQSVVDTGDMPLLPEEPVFEHARLFAEVDAQEAFVQGFFDEAKDINKSIRAMMAQRKKDAAKAAKAAVNLAEKLNESRKYADAIEDILADEYYPLPKYTEILFN